MPKALLSDPPVVGPTGRAITVNAGPKPLDELLTVAAAASRSGTSVSFVDVKARPLEDLVRIAVVGGDAVSFGKDGGPPAATDEEPELPPSGSLRRFLSRLAIF